MRPGSWAGPAVCGPMAVPAVNGHHPNGLASKPAGAPALRLPASCAATGHSRDTGLAAAQGWRRHPPRRRRTGAGTRRSARSSTNRRRRYGAGSVATRDLAGPVAAGAHVAAGRWPGQTGPSPRLRRWTRQRPGGHFHPVRPGHPGATATGQRPHRPAGVRHRHRRRTGYAGFRDGRSGRRRRAAGQPGPAGHASAQPWAGCTPRPAGRAARGTTCAAGHTIAGRAQLLPHRARSAARKSPCPRPAAP